MCINWFSRRNRCCCCQCCRVRADSSSGIYTVYSMQHFADVPMQTHYGSGYTQCNMMESMEDSLQTIANVAETLQNTRNRYNRCNSCNSCNSRRSYNSNCSC